MINYSLEDSVPIIKPVKKTNPKSLTVFLIFMAFYFVVAVFAFSYGDVVFRINDNNSFLTTIITSLKYFEYLTLYIIGFLAFSIATTALCLPLVQNIPSFLIQVAIIGKFIFCFYSIWTGQISDSTLETIAPQYYDDLKKNYKLAVFYCTVTGIILYPWEFLVDLYSVYRIGIKLISLVIKQSCNAISASPLVMLSSTISISLIFLVAILTYYVFVYLMFIGTADIKYFPPHVSYLVVFHCINIISGLWLACFIYTFTLMVHGRIFATWFYTEDKSTFLNKQFLENIYIIIRYYLGTVAYASSLWAFIIVAVTMIKNLRNEVWNVKHNIFVLIPCCYNIYYTLFDSTTIKTTMNDKSYKKSSEFICKLYFLHPLKLYSIIKGSIWCMLSIGGFFFYFCVYIIMTGVKEGSSEIPMQKVLVCFLFIVILMLPSILLLMTAVQTLSLCIFENFKREEENQTGTSFLKAELKDLILPE